MAGGSDGSARSAGVGGAVPHELVQVSVERIGAGFQNDVEDAATRPAILRCKGAGYGLKLGNRVRRRVHRYVFRYRGEIDVPVQVPGVGPRLPPVNGQIGTLHVSRIRKRSELAAEA